MKKISKGLCVVLSIVPSVCFSQATVDIDVKSNVHSISKLIYGTNESYEGATAARWGGNRSTSYNWENNASNGGNDANFSSDNFYDYTASTTPALPILNATKSADSKGQYNLVSLQAAGYVAADKNGYVTEDQAAPSERWKPISFHKSTPYTLTPDVDDDTVYVDELVNYLSTKLGRAGDGGVSAYAIDNEPYLWNQTHALLHPEKTTPAELIEKTVGLSKVIRELAPGADIYGPMFFGWTDAYRWGLTGTDWNDIWNLSRREGYTTKFSWFVDYYLDTLHKVEQATGHRSIDAIAFHWYPESYGKVTKKRIVDLDGVATNSELVAEDMIEARLQAPRALWDSKYQYYGSDGSRSYVDIQGGKAIIQKIKKSIANFYPGTKIAFTEFEYDAEDHWSGGLSLVDVLGIFGREDVYLACKWDVFKSFSMSAYNLYLNYDGKGSQFGSTSVYAMQSDTVALSSFASLDEDNNLHVIVVNKTNEVQTTTFNIENGIFTNGPAFGFGKGSSEIVQLDSVTNMEHSSFSYDVPAYYAVHIILNAIPQSKLVKAKVVDPNADEVIVAFDAELSLVSASEAVNEFAVSVNGDTVDIASVSVDGKNAILKLQNVISPTDEKILVSYLGTNVIGDFDNPVASFDTVYVFNEQAAAPTKAVSAEIDLLGAYISLVVSKEVSSISSIEGISIKQDGEEVEVREIVVSEETSNELYIYPTSRLFKYKTTTLSSLNNTGIVIADGSQLEDFSMDMVGGANFAPEIDSMVVFDNYTVRMYFNTNLDPTTDYDNVGFTISDEEEQTYSYTTKYDKSRRLLTFQINTENPLMAGKTYTMSYVDESQVLTIHNGVLESFSEVLDNKLQDMGAKVVNIPDEVIHAVEYWSRVGDPVVEDCSDTSSLGIGKHLGYIGAKDTYSYKISVPKDTYYTVYFRYASTNPGSLYMEVDGESYHLTLPSTGSFTTWEEAYRAIPLTAGEHDFVLNIVAGGYNVNYIRFVEEEKYPEGALTRATIYKSGNPISVYFSVGIDKLPTPDEITCTCNDTIVIPITSVEQQSETMLRFNFDTIVYIGSKVILSIDSEMTTIDGGIVRDTTVTVSNKSQQVYIPPVIQAIESVEDAQYIISPVPARKGDVIHVVSNSDARVSYTLFTVAGEVVEAGSFVREQDIYGLCEGVYIIRLDNGDSLYTKKIIVR